MSAPMPGAGLSPFVSEDEEYLGLVVTSHLLRSGYITDPLTVREFIRLLDKEDAYWPIGNIGSRFFFNTDGCAPGQIIAIDVNNPARKIGGIVPQGEDVIDEASGGGVGSRLHAPCLPPGRVFSVQGEEEGEIELPAWAPSPACGEMPRASSITSCPSLPAHGVPGRFESRKPLPCRWLCPLSPRNLRPQVFYTSKDGTGAHVHHPQEGAKGRR